MTHSRKTTWLLAQGAAALFGTMALAAPSMAQTPSDQWKFGAVIYGYFPQLGGSLTFPNGTTASITVDPSDYIGNLKFAFMGALEAQKGQSIFFTDLVYADLSGSKSQTRDLSIGGVTIPEGITADASLDVKSTLWTLAGGYRFVATPEMTFDLFGGAREIVLKQNLSYQFSADVGPFVGPLRQGSGSVEVDHWDAILGAKGRFMFGERREWFVPYYIDAGTGQDLLTLQTYAGIGYKFSWGELVAVWRYIEYHFASRDGAEFKMNGPAAGVVFYW